MGARIDPLDVSELAEFAGVIAAIQKDHGYVPNSFLTLGRHPAFLRATGDLADVLWYEEDLGDHARALAAFSFSWFSGVMYSAAHLASYAQDVGLPVEKLRAVDGWEVDPVYSEAERAILRLCHQAASMPGQVRNATMVELRRHWAESQIMVLVGLIAWHAFLNRWNAIIGTEIESIPAARAEVAIGPIGWTPARHAPQEH